MTGTSRIAAAILLAAVLIALAIYARPIQDRYRFKVTSSGQLQRFDTVTGEAQFCRGSRCQIYDRNGVLLTPVDYDPFPNESQSK